MYPNYEMSARIEHQLREQAYRRAGGDPERVWAARERRERQLVSLDLGGARRALRTAALAIISLF
jgi:hypothetical protein